MAYWIFQANPKHYDVEGALRSLDEIVWRVPQHTGSIQPGDRVFLWQSGKHAGIVGVGTVASQPMLRGVPDVERTFVLNPDTEGSEETRVIVRVARVELVAKIDIASMPAMTDHQILTAPMGTVFPLSNEEGEALRAKLRADFPTVEHAHGGGVAWPAAFSWRDRRKDVYPMPGGYDEQVESLTKLIRIVAERRPTLDDFADLVQQEFKSSSSNARHIGLFLRRTGFVDEVSGLLEPSAVGAELLRERNDELVLAHLHQRIRFVGEFLDSVQDPVTATGLLAIANQRYEMGWTTKAQIQRRRGWLQSVGAIRVDDEGRIGLTDSGRAALRRLVLHEPTGVAQPVAVEPPDEFAGTAVPEPGAGDESGTERSVDAIARELVESSTDSGNPDRFERAISAAFEFMGFRAVQVGGSGKTDVIADADLGRDDSYRLIVDGKTTSRDAVLDQQIDWDTIDEHRKLHEADFVVIAGPAFGGSRVVDRARDHGVTLMTASDLEELVRQHAAMPLDLDAYRQLLAAEPGDVDLESLTESVEASQRFLDIAISSLHYVETNVSDVGALSARDLHLLMRAEPELEASEPEIQAALDALASPLVAALLRVGEPNASGGNFRPASDRANTVRRLRLIAQALER